MKSIPFMASLAFACPMFVEFFPDPTVVRDEEGEYVEIRLDDFSADSLFVAFESKPALSFAYPAGSRFVLVHDSAYCPDAPKLSCGSLGNIAMPNSRESTWKLWAGDCSDSVVLPKPKAGYAFQRVRETDEWAFSRGTPGTADPDYEVGFDDCGLASVKAVYGGGEWAVSGWLTGCKSARLAVEFLNLSKLGGWRLDTVAVTERFTLRIRGEAVWLRLHLPRDEAPANDSLDTLLVRRDASPLVISEIHHCPSEPEPEWIELYNGSRYSLPLSRVQFLGRSGFLSDSIPPYGSALVTRDSLSLRSAIGFKDVRIIQANFGYLSNTGGSVLLAIDSTVVDSVGWDKNTAKCPAGFNPRTMLVENTPGFLGYASQSAVGEAPFRYTLSTRVVRRRGDPLRIRVEGESAVSLKLLDSARREVWSFVVPPSSGKWWVVPAAERLGVGVGYVSLSVGEYASVVGIVVRP